MKDWEVFSFLATHVRMRHFSGSFSFKSGWLVMSQSEDWIENNWKLINFGEWMTCQFQNRWQRARWYSEMFSQSSLVDFSGWSRSVAPPSRQWIFYPIWCLMEWFSKRSMKRDHPVSPNHIFANFTILAKTNPIPSGMDHPDRFGFGKTGVRQDRKSMKMKRKRMNLMLTS